MCWNVCLDSVKPLCCWCPSCNTDVRDTLKEFPEVNLIQVKFCCLIFGSEFKSTTSSLQNKVICYNILIPFKPDESSNISTIIRADYIFGSDVSVTQVFLRKGKDMSQPFFFFFLNNTCFMDYFLFQKWVFLCWGCWPCLSGCATVGCSSLSDAERVLNLDVIQGKGQALSHKGLLSGSLFY